MTLHQVEPVDSASGLELILTREPALIAAAQRLRYEVFVTEMGAATGAECHAQRREIDAFDPFCDHLVVVDRARSTPDLTLVVGAYRLLRRSVAEPRSGFYSAGEFDLGPLLGRAGEILELGRSCVAPAYRSGQVVQLLWRGLGAYVDRHDIELMFGCASLPGIDRKAVAQALAWLHAHHRAPIEIRPRALAPMGIPMDLIPPQEIDEALARRQLPPLLKGYLLAGAKVGEGAVVDPVFKTIDVCVVLPTERVRARNRKRFQKREADPVLAAA